MFQIDLNSWDKNPNISTDKSYSCHEYSYQVIVNSSVDFKLHVTILAQCNNDFRGKRHYGKIVSNRDWNLMTKYQF